MSPIMPFFSSKKQQYVRRGAYETHKSAGFCDSCHGVGCISDSEVGNVVQINRMMDAEET